MVTKTKKSKLAERVLHVRIDKNLRNQLEREASQMSKAEGIPVSVSALARKYILEKLDESPAGK